MHAKPFFLALALGAAVGGLAGGLAEAKSTFGCFKVTVDEINIRSRPYSTAKVIGTASKGEILEKRKMWCTPRGYWCAVRKGDLEGYADKNFMKRVSCP